MNNTQSQIVRFKAIVGQNDKREFVDMLLSSNFGSPIVSQQVQSFINDGILSQDNTSDDLMELIASTTIRHLIQEKTESVEWSDLYGQLITMFLNSDSKFNQDDDIAIMMFVKSNPDEDKIEVELKTRLIDATEDLGRDIFPSDEVIKNTYNELFNK